jgi:MFS family permease
VEEAKATLQAANPEVDAAQTVREILSSADVSTARPAEPFFSKRYSTPIMLAVLFAFFNQLSGINAIIYYAPRIFEMTGLGKSSALLSSAGVGLINFLFTLLAMNFIDRFGRRTLMLIGSVGLIVTLGLVSFAFFTESFQGYAVPIYLFVYIAFFAFSQGAVIWVFISEIFPNQVRAYGQALGSFTHWLLAAVIAFAFPYIAETLGGGLTFLIFCVMMVLQLIFVWRMMPETKETSLEEIEKEVVQVEVS